MGTYMPFSIDEIIQMLTDGGEINPLEWGDGDKLRFCLANIGAVITKMNHVCVEHLRSEEEGFEGEVDDPAEIVTAFQELDACMLLMHNTHTVMQSVLTPEIRNVILGEKISMLTGVPTKVIGITGNLVLMTTRGDEVPDDLSGIEGDEADVERDDDGEPDHKLEWGGEDRP